MIPGSNQIAGANSQLSTLREQPGILLEKMKIFDSVLGTKTTFYVDALINSHSRLFIFLHPTWT